MKRDAKADLELCQKATQGPWVYLNPIDGVVALTNDDDDDDNHICKPEFCEDQEDDMEFIAESREALPHWIERAMAAEEKLAQRELFCEIPKKLTEDFRLLKIRVGAMQKVVDAANELAKYVKEVNRPSENLGFWYRFEKLETTLDANNCGYEK